MAQGRRRRRIPAIAAGIFLLIGTAPERGYAQDATGATETTDTQARATSVRLDYRAPTTCPSRDAFLDAVRRYTTKWSLVDDGATRRFAITLEPHAQVVRGTLEIVVHERRTQKVVSGPTCAAVARALAVVVALVIDPGASPSAPKEESAPDAPETATVDPSSTPVPAPVSPPSELTPLARPNEGLGVGTTTRPRRKRHSRASPQASPRSARWLFGAQIEATSAVTSRALAVTKASVDLLIPLIGKADRDHTLLGPSSIGVGLRQSLPSEIGVPGGSTRFLWSAVTVRACPLRFHLRLLGEAIDVTPCIESNVGVLQIETHGIPLAQRTTKYWFDGGASAVGIWHLPRPWVVTAELSVVAPLTRHRFEVVDLTSLSEGSTPRSELVSQAPRLGFSAGMGLGLEF